MKKLWLAFFVLGASLHGQQLFFNEAGRLTQFIFGEETVALPQPLPFASLEVNGRLTNLLATSNEKQFQIQDEPELIVTLSEATFRKDYCVATLVIQNTGPDTLTLRNLVLSGTDSSRHYITGYGDHWLSRSRLFRPGQSSVPVILPDDAWELGFADVPIRDNRGIVMLCRRKSWTQATRRRFETDLYPGGTVTYSTFWMPYTGPWQSGLRTVFQEHYLFDLDTSFEDHLYRRQDLAWIRDVGMIHLMMSWDRNFYDPVSDRYTCLDFLRQAKHNYGGIDVLGIWPTWPTLGLDERNQYDMFRTLPGGLGRLRQVVDSCHQLGTKVFIAYNPWDASTRPEDHYAGLEELTRKLNIDGAILDTRGNASVELQNAVDRAKSGVVLFSEGMAVPKDMPGIITGRVHNALYYPPVLNLNKFIRPDFAIFRVAEWAYEPIRREYALSLFNGYGIEINAFRPGYPDWIEPLFPFLDEILRHLDQHRSTFMQDFTPLVETLDDEVLVNRWGNENKVLYTLMSSKPAGFDGPLFAKHPGSGWHYIDLWHHEETILDTISGKVYIHTRINPYPQAWQGTNNEGEPGILAGFKSHLSVALTTDSLFVSSDQDGLLQIWKSCPSSKESPVTISLEPSTPQHWHLNDLIGLFEGKLIVQLLDDQGELWDERIVNIPPSIPRLVGPQRSFVHCNDLTMRKIPAGTFHYTVTHGYDFIPYPEPSDHGLRSMPSFYMDTHPVTNRQFQAFLKAANYQPADTSRFLAHWSKGKIPAGQEDFPVVYVSLEDAQAYAAWAGKRLPTEAEWQYASQTKDGNDWPWGMVYDSTLCNPGNDHPESVGSHPAGANPYGLQDLVGLVWQLTADTYVSGSYRYLILKGGSYYHPTASGWYVEGGPKSLQWQQQLLRVSQGFERNATVGFRCVADAIRK